MCAYQFLLFELMLFNDACVMNEITILRNAKHQIDDIQE